MSGTPSVGLRYRFGAGWKFVRLEPKDAAARKIEGGPRAFGIWVHGDGQGGAPCIRLRDATGQTHQVRGEPVSWKGWRTVTFPLRPAADCRQSRQEESAAYSVSGQTMIPLPDASAEQRPSSMVWGHWGGANDGECICPSSGIAADAVGRSERLPSFRSSCSTATGARWRARFSSPRRRWCMDVHVAALVKARALFPRGRSSAERSARALTSPAA